MIDEVACLSQIAKGNEKALRDLYENYSVNAYNTIISYTQDAEDAEEILQDVFITIHNSAAKFNFKSKIGTWIYRISVNKSLDFLRKKNAEKRKGIFTSLYKKDSGEIKIDSPDFNHPGVKMENKEDAQYLFKVIETLPEKQKTAFILTQIEDLPYKEAAKVMDVSSKAIESLVQRAKINLRKGLVVYFPNRGNYKKNTSK